MAGGGGGGGGGETGVPHEPQNISPGGIFSPHAGHSVSTGNLAPQSLQKSSEYGDTAPHCGQILPGALCWSAIVSNPGIVLYSYTWDYDP